MQSNPSDDTFLCPPVTTNGNFFYIIYVLLNFDSSNLGEELNKLCFPSDPNVNLHVILYYVYVATIFDD